MEYRRKIQDSEYYKQIVNDIDNKINKLESDIKSLNDKYKEIKKIYDNNWEQLCKQSELEKKLGEMFYAGAKKDYKIKGVAGTIMAFGTGITICNALMYNLSVDGSLTSIQNSLITIINFALAGMGGFLITIGIKEEIPELSESFIEKNMKKKKNADLVNKWQKIQQKNKELNLKCNQIFHNLHDIDKNITIKQKERDYLQSKKKAIVDLASNYDNIRLLDRLIDDGINIRQIESKKESPKIFKKTRDYNMYYQNRIKTNTR